MRIESAIEFTRKASNQCCRIGKGDRRPSRAERSKCPVHAVCSAGAVGGYDPEMICAVHTQATDIGTNVLIGVSRLSLGGCVRSVAGRSSILKMHGGRQPVGLNRPV